MLDNGHHYEEETPYPLPTGSMTGILTEGERERLLAEGEELPDLVKMEREIHRKKMEIILARRKKRLERESIIIPDNHPQLAGIKIKLFREIVKEKLKKHPKWTFQEVDENGMVLLMVNTRGRIVKRLPLGEAAIGKNRGYKYLHF